MENELKRPITVRIEDFRKDINDSVNSSELPAYLVEVFLNEYLTEIKKIAQREYAQCRDEWIKMCSDGSHDNSQ